MWSLVWGQSNRASVAAQPDLTTSRVDCADLHTILRGKVLAGLGGDMMALPLFDLLTMKQKALLPFPASEGTNGHCEPMGLQVRNERVYDWLATVMPRPPSK